MASWRCSASSCVVGMVRIVPIRLDGRLVHKILNFGTRWVRPARASRAPCAPSAYHRCLFFEIPRGQIATTVIVFNHPTTIMQQQQQQLLQQQLQQFRQQLQQQPASTSSSTYPRSALRRRQPTRRDPRRVRIDHVFRVRELDFDTGVIVFDRFIEAVGRFSHPERETRTERMRQIAADAAVRCMVTRKAYEASPCNQALKDALSVAAHAANAAQATLSAYVAYEARQAAMRRSRMPPNTTPNTMPNTTPNTRSTLTPDGAFAKALALADELARENAEEYQRDAYRCQRLSPRHFDAPITPPQPLRLLLAR